MANKTVLLVEDDKSIGHVVDAALSAEGYEVVTCPSVERRDAILAERTVDLLITDVFLEDADGIETLEPVKAAHPDLPVIVISAQNTLDMAVRASETGAYEYFPKPFDLDELVRAAKQALHRDSAAAASAEEDIASPRMPLVGRSPAMQEVYRLIARLLHNDLSVLILGESGTGKELVAEAIHNLGRRKTGPFIPVNMAAIPSELIEAELFGHEKGAFTGAVSQAIGKFEQAQGGTLFLDEIGDMPMEAQTRLLRALQSGSISRVGGKTAIRLDVRIVAATNRDLEEQVRRGAFREDLYYRLNVVPIELPPLRDRLGDIDALAQHFLALAASEGLPRKQIGDGALAELKMHGWPGNVRELKNIIYRAVVVSREDVIAPDTVASLVSADKPRPPAEQTVNFGNAVREFLRRAAERGDTEGRLYQDALAAMEKPLLESVLRQVGGNQLRAASMLGINRNTLRKKLTELDIDPHMVG